MSEITIEKIEKSEEYIKKLRGDLDKLMNEYNENKIHHDAVSLLGIKDKFISLLYSVNTVESRYLELYLISRDERKTREYILKMKYRKDGETVTNSEWKSELESAEEKMKERITEINHKSVRNLRDTCKSMIDAIIQKISVTKYEEFSSRNTNAA